MGYYLQALVCRRADADPLIHRFRNAVKVDLGQGLALVPMTEDLYDELCASQPLLPAAAADAPLELLTPAVERAILATVGDTRIAYLEAEYFGGEGGQAAVVWKAGAREEVLPFGQDRINQVLASFGVVAGRGEDAFLTLGFGRYRHTDDWLQDADGPL